MNIAPATAKSIFLSAVEEHAPQDWPRFLDHACGDDRELRHAVEQLLAAHSGGVDLIEQGRQARNNALTTVLPPTGLPLWNGPGMQIGPYKLLEEIGEGGMGIVYLAERTQPVKRKVALKIIKPGMDSRQVIARFETERQALALMDHPNIARILDAGAVGFPASAGGTGVPASAGLLSNEDRLKAGLQRGLPYFVMELVRGLPITDYCDQVNLDTRGRLALFVDVCRAVQHAHQRGIIHRDLKPSNILVASESPIGVPPLGGSVGVPASVGLLSNEDRLKAGLQQQGLGVVKVIDFGVAKALNQELTERSLRTHFSQMIGTPLYMSPEQAEMSDLDIDTRTDVYSLGVLLYELLTGTTPFDKETLKSAGFDELRRIIREDEPPRPSHRINTLEAAHLSTVSQHRSIDPRRLSTHLRGELDWIVLKCLEKDRNRRYESASALADDLFRYLRDDEVAACPPSIGYRISKFVRRNRVAALTTTVVAMSLIVGTAIAVLQAIDAHAARKLADERLLLANARLQSEQQAHREVEVQRNQSDILRQRAEAGERQAAAEAAIARAVSDFLQRDLLGQAVSEVAASEVGEEPFITVREAVHRAAARIDERFRDQPLVEAAIRTTIGSAYNQLFQWQLALPHLERAVTLRAAYLGHAHADTLDSMQKLSSALEWTGRFPEMIALRKQILEHKKAQLGPDHPETLSSMGTLASAYHSAGEWHLSVPLLEEVLEKQRIVCGPAHPRTLSAMHNLAMNYASVNRLDESMALHEKVLESMRSRLGADPAAMDWPMKTYAGVCQAAGRLHQAEMLFRETLEINRKRADSLIRRQAVANSAGRLALNLSLQQRYAEAEPLAREALTIYEDLRLPNSGRFQWASVLGGVLAGQKKHEEAETLLLQGYEGLKQQEGIMLASGRHWIVEAAERLVRFYESTQQPEKAQMWRDRMNEKPSPITSSP